MMKISSYIDHTLLKPEATSAQIRKLCQEALDHHFFGVCVNSMWLPEVRQVIKGSPVRAVAVVGFPLGAMASKAKAFEAEWSVQHGAAEIDMVLAIGALKEKNYSLVEADIAEVVRASGSSHVKVILETFFLSEEEKRDACKLALEAGASFVKTCTGFSGGAATVEDIRFMRSVVGPSLGVKASGGIKTPEQALALIEAGATRLGTSSGVLLVAGQNSQGGY